MTTSQTPTRSLRERGCTSKVRFDSAPEAELAAMTRMLTSADVPLSVYACRFCTGFHLTSSQVVSDTTVVMPTPVTKTYAPVALAREMGKEGFAARRKKWRERERVRRAQQRRRNRGTAEFFAKTPAPQPATAAEVEAFFAAHLPIA